MQEYLFIISATSLLLHSAPAAPVPLVAQALPAISAPEPGKPATPIDATARAPLTEMIAAYRRLTSYSGDVAVAYDAQSGGKSYRATIAFAKPGKAAVTVQDARGETRAVADGTHLFAAASRNAAEYLKTPVAPEDALRRALQQAGAGGTGPMIVLMGRDPLAPLSAALQKLERGPDATLDGVAVETVVAHLDGPAGKADITYAIGKQDRLLRRITVERRMGEKTLTITETHTNVRANPDLPPATFAFAPPAGAAERFVAAPASRPESAAPTASVGTAAPAGVGEATRPQAAPSAAPPGAPIRPAAAPPRTLAPPSANRPAAPVSVGLAFVTEPGVTASAPNVAVFDFGAVRLLDKSRIERTFTLKNDGKETIRLARLHAPCGCTTALAGGGAGAPLPSLAPGQSAPVAVTLNLNAVAPGAVNKHVDVYVQGKDAPVARMELTGTLAPAVTFSPPALDFGNVTAGQTATRTVTATVDARLAEKDLPLPVSDYPGIRIAAAPAAPSAEPGMRAQAYTVTLAADAPLGPIGGVLRYPPPAAMPGKAQSPSPLSAVFLPLRGQVRGDVSAMPAAVALALVPVGTEATGQVTLHGIDARALESLSVETDNPQITAKLGTMEKIGGPSGATRPLEVTIAKTVPAGPFRARVMVKTASGQRLVLPVSAYVQPGK